MAEDENGRVGLDLLPDRRVGALTQIFREYAPADTPVMIERVVEEVDSIVKEVRYEGCASRTRATGWSRARAADHRGPLRPGHRAGPLRSHLRLRGGTLLSEETESMERFWGLSSTVWTGIYTILTFGLLAVAVVAAIYAHGQWQASKKQIADARKAQLEAMRPYVIVTVEPSEAGRHIFDLVVRNIGHRPAMDVTIRLDPPPKQASEVEGFELAKTKLLNEPIAMIAPDQEIRTFYDSQIERKGVEGLPTAHRVSLLYHDTSGEVYEESSVIDLDAMRGATFVTVKTVHDIGKTLDKIEEILKKASLLKGDGALHVQAVTENQAENSVRLDREQYEKLLEALDMTRKMRPESPDIPMLERKITEWQERHAGTGGDD